MSEFKLLKDLEGNSVKTEIKNNKLLLKNIHNQELFNSVLVANANKRSNNANTLTKAEVRGGGKKPYRQKHTGRARQGSIRNPHYVGGGVAFGPTNQKNYTLKQNKKAYKLAFKSAITLKINDANLCFLSDQFKDLDKPATKKINKMLVKNEFDKKKVLFVFNTDNQNFFKSVKNMVNVNALVWNQVSAYDILKSDILILQETAFNKMSEVFG